MIDVTGSAGLAVLAATFVLAVVLEVIDERVAVRSPRDGMRPRLTWGTAVRTALRVLLVLLVAASLAATALRILGNA